MHFKGCLQHPVKAVYFSPLKPVNITITEILFLISFMQQTGHNNCLYKNVLLLITVYAGA
jgi:hypothetical protein